MKNRKYFILFLFSLSLLTGCKNNNDRTEINKESKDVSSSVSHLDKADKNEDKETLITEENREIKNEVNNTIKKIDKIKNNKEIKILDKEKHINIKDSDKEYKKILIKKEETGREDNDGRREIKKTFVVEKNITKELVKEKQVIEIKNALIFKRDILLNYIKDSIKDLEEFEEYKDLKLLNTYINDPKKDVRFAREMRFLLQNNELPELWYHTDKNWILGKVDAFTYYVENKMWEMDLDKIEVLDIKDVSNKDAKIDGRKIITESKIKYNGKIYMLYLTIIGENKFELLDFKEV